MIGLRYTYIHTKWNIMWPWKEWDIAICSNMDGPRENIMLSEVSHMKVKVKSLSHVQLFVTPWTVAYQASLSMGFSRQEYWSGVPLPSPGDLPSPGIKPGSPAFQADALPLSHQGRFIDTDKRARDGSFQ